jgi:hypothetical protein
MEEAVTPTARKVHGGSAVDGGWMERHPRLDGLYRKHQKRIPLLTFCLGFLWDALTLTRIDRMSDNLFVLGYLAGLAVMIIVQIRRRSNGRHIGWLARVEPHFEWATQFLIGGLLSSYVVFYFKSVSWTQTQVFFALLVGLLVGNEFLERRLGNERLLAILFTFCLFSFLAFFIPVLLARVGTLVYLAAGVITLAVSLAVFSVALPLRTREGFRRFRVVGALICGVWFIHMLFYFTNLIPPVPLSLKDAAIYHSVRRTSEGYEVSFVRPSAFRFWRKSDDPFLFTPGEAAYCYTSIFAPRGIRVPVRHVWSVHEKGSGWRITDRIGFDIFGGRDGGFRGHSRKSTLKRGFWRVQVETEAGQILGEVIFEVAMSPQTHPPLETRMIR